MSKALLQVGAGSPWGEVPFDGWCYGCACTSRWISIACVVTLARVAPFAGRWALDLEVGERLVGAVGADPVCTVRGADFRLTPENATPASPVKLERQVTLSGGAESMPVCHGEVVAIVPDVPAADATDVSCVLSVPGTLVVALVNP